MFRFYLFLCFLFSLSLHAENPLEVTFQNLSDGHHKLVIVRGFLYHSEQHGWVLSPEPNLKTCCIGIDRKSQQQIMLEGTFANESNSRALSFKGLLLSENTDTGVKWHLKQATLEETNNEGAKVGALILLFFVLLGGFAVSIPFLNYKINIVLFILVTLVFIGFLYTQS